MLIGFLGRGLTKNQYRGGSCRKREGLDILHFADLKGGVCKKEERGALEGRGVDTQMPTTGRRKGNC